MKTFKITYGNGKTQEMKADLTVAQVINQVFGLSPEQMEEYGAKVEEVDAEETDAEETVKEETVKEETVQGDDGSVGPAEVGLQGFAPSVTQTNLPAEEPAAPAPKAARKKN